MKSEIKKTILEALNSSLKYGKQLMMDADEDDTNMSIEIWRKNEQIQEAINLIESL